MEQVGPRSWEGRWPGRGVYWAGKRAPGEFSLGSILIREMRSIGTMNSNWWEVGQKRIGLKAVRQLLFPGGNKSHNDLI